MLLRSLPPRRDLAVELLLVNLPEDFADARPWREAERQHVSTEQQRRRRRCSTPSARARSMNQSIAEQSKSPARPRQSARARRAEQLQIDLLREPPERAVA